MEKISLQEFTEKFSGSQQSDPGTVYQLSQFDTGEMLDVTGEPMSLVATLDASQQGVAEGKASTQLAIEGQLYIIRVSRSFWEEQAYGQISIDILKNEKWQDCYQIKEQEQYEFPFQDIVEALVDACVDVNQHWRGDLSSSFDSSSYYS